MVFGPRVRTSAIPSFAATWTACTAIAPGHRIRINSMKGGPAAGKVSCVLIAVSQIRHRCRARSVLGRAFFDAVDHEYRQRTPGFPQLEAQLLFDRLIDRHRDGGG